MASIKQKQYRHFYGTVVMYINRHIAIQHQIAVNILHDKLALKDAQIDGQKAAIEVAVAKTTTIAVDRVMPHRDPVKNDSFMLVANDLDVPTSYKMVCTTKRLTQKFIDGHPTLRVALLLSTPNNINLRQRCAVELRANNRIEGPLHAFNIKDSLTSLTTYYEEEDMIEDIRRIDSKRFDV